ncbi:1835_t:CDS:2, partial [Acaulospora morrowiae]
FKDEVFVEIGAILAPGGINWESSFIIVGPDYVKRLIGRYLTQPASESDNSEEQVSLSK